MTLPLLPRRRDKGLPFTPANKNLLGERLVTRVLMVPALKRAFGGVYAFVDPLAKKLRAERGHPVIFCLTHSGWWDGHVAYLLSKHVFKRDSYLMMEDRQLARYFFFTWAGVFGVSRDDPRKALASLEYIAGRLSEEPDAVLWMFPQGKMVHPEMRPLNIYGGAANIARRLEKCAIVPVAIRYEFILEQAPDVFARVGPPLFISAHDALSAKAITTHIEAAMTKSADKLRADVMSHNLGAYRRLLSGRSSINKLWDGVLKVAGKTKRFMKHG